MQIAALPRSMSRRGVEPSRVLGMATLRDNREPLERWRDPLSKCKYYGPHRAPYLIAENDAVKAMAARYAERYGEAPRRSLPTGTLRGMDPDMWSATIGVDLESDERCVWFERYSEDRRRMATSIIKRVATYPDFVAGVFRLWGPEVEYFAYKTLAIGRNGRDTLRGIVAVLDGNVVGLAAPYDYEAPNE